MGTNKTQTLRFDQYTSRPDLGKISGINIHDNRFDYFNNLPRIVGKYKQGSMFDYDRCIGRIEASPRNAGHSLTVKQPNSPAGSTYHCDDIPRFYKG